MRVCGIGTTTSPLYPPPRSVQGKCHFNRMQTRTQGLFSLKAPVQDKGISSRGRGHQHFSIPAAWSCRGSVPGKSTLRNLGHLFLHPAPASGTELPSSPGRPTVLGLQSPAPQLPYSVEILCWKKYKKKTRRWYLSPVPCSQSRGVPERTGPDFMSLSLDQSAQGKWQAVRTEHAEALCNRNCFIGSKMWVVQGWVLPKTMEILAIISDKEVGCSVRTAS